MVADRRQARRRHALSDGTPFIEVVTEIESRKESMAQALTDMELHLRDMQRKLEQLRRLSRLRL